MTTRPRRVARRLLEVFDYRTFAVAAAFITVLLVGYIVFSAFRAAHDATQSAQQRGQAASRRIDLLNAQIAQLQSQIASGKDERGQLASKVDALIAQVRQLHGTPVVTVTVSAAPAPNAASPSPHPAPSPTTNPRPTPSRTPRPSPTPSPTCTRLPVVGTCRPLRVR